MKRKYELANKVIEIESLHEYIHNMCKDYLTEKPAEIFVGITQQDIGMERVYAENTAEKEGRTQISSDSYLETLAVYRKIATELLSYNTILFHGSAIAVDGEGYIFTAKSGTGKSTHTANWRKLFKERAVMINDDKPLIHVSKSGAYVFGTPWNGKHHLSTNTSVPVKAVCILTRDKSNHIERIEPRTAYSMILQQTYRVNNAGGLKKILEIIDDFSKKVNFYKLGCNMEIDSAQVAYDGMKG